MQKLNSGGATPQEVKRFGELWQQRVEHIFQNKEQVIEILP